MAMRMLHGTSTKFIKAIEKGGLNNAYLTDLEDMASYFAEEAAEMSGGKPLVLIMDISDTECLVPDYAMYEEPLTFVKDKHDVRSDDDWAEAIEDGTVPYPRNKGDWETSLDGVSSVICRGWISPEAILEVVEW